MQEGGARGGSSRFHRGGHHLSALVAVTWPQYRAAAAGGHRPGPADETGTPTTVVHAGLRGRHVSAAG